MSKKKHFPKRVRRSVRDALIVPFAKAIMAATPRLSLESVQRTGNVIGAVLALIPGERRRRVERHLELAFPPPEFSAAWRRRVLRESYLSMAKLILEAVWASAWKPGDRSRVEIADPDSWQRTIDLARERGRGLVLFTGHLGTFEMLGKWIQEETGMPLLAVAGKPKSEAMAGLMKQQREAAGYRLVWRGEAGPAAMRHLRAGGMMVILVDHNLKGEGISIPFFGQEAHTLLAPARLALQSGAVANTVFCLRDGPGKVRLEVGEPWENLELPADKKERFRAQASLAAQYTRRIEEAVRRNPGQYLWMHRRWQKRPETLPFPS